MTKRGTMRHVWEIVCFFTLIALYPSESLNWQGVVYYADHVLHNGKIITVDDTFSISQGVAIRDGKLVEVGSNQQVLAHALSLIHI